MALPQWTVLTGYDFGEFDEKTTVSIDLPLADTTGVTVSLISGELPGGIRIEDYKLKGVPFEVNRTIEYEFTLRASTVEGVLDRTFTMTIQGADAPVWQTPEGLLNIGVVPKGQYWVDTRNTNWGLYNTGGSSNFSAADVVVYEGIPTRDEGSDGDYAFVTSLSEYWFKTNGKWYPFNFANVQTQLGSDQEFIVSNTVPNPNIVDYWLNTNILNNGLDIKLKRFDTERNVWLPVTYTVGTTAPVTPGDDFIWVQTFDDSLRFVIKRFDAAENTWEVLKFEYNTLPPDRAERAYFILDNSLVDFQLQAIDTDLSANGSLRFYIADGDGELPPGLTLSEDGKISGIVDPLLALDKLDDPGYDIGSYDSGLFDFGLRDDFGYDSYFYDVEYYGFTTRIRRPKKLNRRFQFIVTAADEVSETKREFGIYLVGDDFLRADNTIMQAGTGIFTADNTYLRNPLWITPGDLGFRRANNYQTIYLDVHDPNSLVGLIRYNLRDTNDDGTPSILPPGLELDRLTGELAGRVPYQPAVSREYKFTVEALRIEGDNTNVVDDFVADIYADTLPGRTSIQTNKQTLTLDGNIRDINILVGKEILIDQHPYFVQSVDKTNSDYDVLNLDRAIVPLSFVSPLKLQDEISVSDDFARVYYNSLIREEYRNFWRGKTLNYSTTESYTVLGMQENVSLTIYSADSVATDLNFNYDEAGLVPVPGEEPRDAFKRYIEQILVNLNVDPANQDIDIKKVSATEISALLPAFSLTRNRNQLKKLFHTDDSTAVEVIYGNNIIPTSSYWVVFFDKSFTRNVAKDSQITLGALKDTTIRQRLTVAETEIVSSIKTFTVNMLGEVDSTIQWVTDSTLTPIIANRISYLKLEATTSLAGGLLKYNLISGSLPNGLTLKGDGEIIGKVNQYSEDPIRYRGIFKSNRFYYLNDVVKHNGSYYKCIDTYNVGDTVLITDEQYWESYDLDGLQKGLTYNDNAFNIWLNGFDYQPGDTVVFGDIKYKCNQAHTSSNLLTNANRPDYDTTNIYWIVSNGTTFDGSTTTFDRSFSFRVLARDRFGYSAVAKDFNLEILEIDDKNYSNLYMQPFLKQTQRDLFSTFINDYNIFQPQYIYRPSDQNFGIQKSLRSLVYAGIEQKSISSYVSGVALNHRRKRFKFGEIKTAVAKQPGTNDVVYEVVYIELHDPQEPTSGETNLVYKVKTQNTVKVNQVNYEVNDDETSLESDLDVISIGTRDGSQRIQITQNQLGVVIRGESGDEIINIVVTGQITVLTNSLTLITIRTQSGLQNTSSDPFRFRPVTPVISADSNAIKVSQTKDQIRYISNISNMRKRISNIGLSERQFLPLWMRTSQGTNIEEIDYVLAMPLCYCKPGTAETIKENIINNGFDFKVIDYDIDRFIIDRTADNSNEQFILFPNYNFNV